MESELPEDLEPVEEEPVQEELDPNNPEHAFAILEQDFNKVLAEIEQSPEAAQYSDEFSGLFNALYQYYEKEKLATTKSSNLQFELDMTNQRLENALKVIDTDQSMIDDLKSQLEKSWRMADSAHSREQAAQEVIDNLRKQVEALTYELEIKSKLAQDTGEEGGGGKKKEGLQREKERLAGEVTQLTQKLQNALSYQEELEHKNSAADLRINELSLQVDEQTQDLDRQRRMESKLVSEIGDLKMRFEEKESHINELNDVVNVHLKQISRLEFQLREERVHSEKLSRDLENCQAKHAKLHEEFIEQQNGMEELKKVMAQKAKELKMAEDAYTHARSDMVKAVRAKDAMDKKIAFLDSEKADFIQERQKLRQHIMLLEKDIDDHKKQTDLDKRAMDAVIREKEILNKSMARQQGVQNDMQKLIKIQEQQKKKLEAELDSFYIETNKQKKAISKLERERDRLSEEQIDLTKQVEETMEQVKLKKAQVFDLKKSLSEQQNKFRMQQNLFDVIRADRNALQKQLQEATAECGELRKKLKITSHQTEQLKEDIAMKESEMIKEENFLRKVTKEKEYLRAELNSANEQIKHLKGDIQQMSEEETRLHQTIMKNEKLIREQAKDLEQLMNERDILGSQLVRRNDEIALAHEKINILQSTLQKGQAQYEQRLEDIKLLKIEIKRLRQEKLLLTKSADNMADLRQEVFHLERDLTRARLKCRALEEEVQNPLNVHRWRKLEGSDPEVLDLLQKIQILQKRILQQSSEAVERERQLKESERLYLNLRQVLAKQPGPGIKDELQKTQRALKSRGNKLKSLISELNMAERQAMEYKSILQKVTDELNALKKKHMESKKSEARKVSSNQRNNFDQGQIVQGPPIAQNVKFTGGGFRMSVDRV